MSKDWGIPLCRSRSGIQSMPVDHTEMPILGCISLCDRHTTVLEYRLRKACSTFPMMRKPSPPSPRVLERAAVHMYPEERQDVARIVQPSQTLVPVGISCIDNLSSSGLPCCTCLYCRRLQRFAFPSRAWVVTYASRTPKASLKSGYPIVRPEW